jgi:membrane fusion protein (multidrug efflux system)
MSDDEKKDEFEFTALHGDEEPSPKAPAPKAAEPPPEKPAGESAVTKVKEQFIPKIKTWVAGNKNVALVLGFVAVGILMYGISRMHDDDTADADAPAAAGTADEIPVNVIEARVGRFQDVISAVGTLKGEAEIELRFEVDGKIEEFNVSEGAKIGRGQIIARLSQRDANLKIQRAKLELEQKEKLYALGGIAKTQLDEARLNMDVAQTELDKTQLKASRDGIIGDKDAEIGEFVNPQRKIATLVAIKNVVVEVGIIEKQIDKVYPGQKIIVTVDAYPGQVFDGKIETISPLISSDGSKTFSIRAKIPNANSLLLPGMFARAKVITYEADDAISVPNDALVKTSGGFQIFVVNKDNVAEARDVNVGYVATEFTQIESGLTPGEIVVVQKPPELKAGSKVKVIEVQK